MAKYRVSQFQNFGLDIALKIEFSFRTWENRIGEMNEEAVK